MEIRNEIAALGLVSRAIAFALALAATAIVSVGTTAILVGAGPDSAGYAQSVASVDAPAATIGG